MGTFVDRPLLYSPYKPGGDLKKWGRAVSNLSFAATTSKHKLLIFLEKVGGLWFLASGK